MNQKQSNKRTSNLTARTVKAIKPEATPFRVWDNDLKGFHIRVQPPGSMSYYFHYRTETGKAVSYLTGKAGTLSQVQARDVAVLKAAEVTKGHGVQAEKKQKRNEAKEAKLKTLRGLIENKYGPWYESEYKTGRKTLQAIQRQFAHLMDKPLISISDWDIRKWRAREKKRGRADAGINRELASFKALLSKAVAVRMNGGGCAAIPCYRILQPPPLPIISNR